MLEAVGVVEIRRDHEAISGASYYPYLLALAAIVTIQFGLLKTKEEKEGIPLYEEEESAAESL